jgi:hypothetical protein
VAKQGRGAARRQQRRQAIQRRRRLRRSIVIGGAVIVIGGVGALVAVGGSHSSNNVPVSGNRIGSRAVGGKAVAIGTVPDAYQIVYRVDGGGRGVVTTARLMVKRPFDARQETLGGPPPGHDVSGVTIQTLGRFRTQIGTQDPTVYATPPAPASLDLRPEAALSAVLKGDLLVRRERRVVAGRPCQVYRSAESLGGGPVTAWKPTSKTWTDTCIDGTGLVLETVSVEKGKVLNRRVAINVTINPVLDDTLFAAGDQTVPPKKGGGSFQKLDPSSRLPGRFWDLPQPPAGFTFAGRYAARPPQPDVFSDPTRIGELIGGVSDVYTSGNSVIIVDQGATLGGGKPFGAEPTAQAVDLGQLGAGQLVLSLGGSEARVDLGKGTYVRVSGTVDPSVLVDVARRLVPGPGGSLVIG